MEGCARHRQHLFATPAKRPKQPRSRIARLTSALIPDQQKHTISVAALMSHQAHARFLLGYFSPGLGFAPLSRASCHAVSGMLQVRLPPRNHCQ